MGSRAAGRAIGIEAKQVARLVEEAFDGWHAAFHALSRVARERFATRAWSEGHADARARLDLYGQHLSALIDRGRERLGDAWSDPATWHAAKSAMNARVRGRPDQELAETWYNSACRRSIGTQGIDESTEFVPFLEGRVRPGGPPPFLAWSGAESTAAVLQHLLEATGLASLCAHAEDDTRLAAERIDAELGSLRPDAFEFLPVPFFRNKGAYLVGRAWLGEHIVPVALALVHPDEGVRIDAVLLTSGEVSVVFGFSWSYFHFDIERPRPVVSFLRSILPAKRTDELYNAIGYERHGKTELYSLLFEHLARPGARFERARGVEGLVMAVFTLPSLNVVFKIIKDRFGASKTVTRAVVRDRYHLVFVHDRVGRLADFQTYERLLLRRDHFDPELLTYLLEVAGRCVHVEGDQVLVDLAYVQRRLRPLDLFAREADPEARADAMEDYGQAIRDLAASGIFPGDMLLKNFGVTRHGRVVFYDYDEISLLGNVRFRRIPPPRDPHDEFSDEVWFRVSDNDVFPEEFGTFMGVPGDLRERFAELHGDLYDPRWWRSVQKQVGAGELLDVYPYRTARRLHPKTTRYEP